MDRQEIRPVLNGLSVVFWRVDDRAVGTADDEKVVTSLSLAIAATVCNGYADLVIAAKTGNSGKVRFHTLRYDGYSYPFDLMDLWIELGGKK